jgi:hypothetical protein
MLDLTEFYPKAHNVCKIYGLEEPKLDNVRAKLNNANFLLAGIEHATQGKESISSEDIAKIYANIKSVKEAVNYALEMLK